MVVKLMFMHGKVAKQGSNEKKYTCHKKTVSQFCKETSKTISKKQEEAGQSIINIGEDQYKGQFAT